MSGVFNWLEPMQRQSASLRRSAGEMQTDHRLADASRIAAVDTVHCVKQAYGQADSMTGTMLR